MDTHLAPHPGEEPVSSQPTAQPPSQSPSGGPPAGNSADRQTLQTFTEVQYDVPQPVVSRRGLYMFLGCMAVGLIGMLIWALTPSSKAVATPADPDYVKMTNRELAENGSMMAAKELTRRMMEGHPADTIDVATAVRKYGSPRMAANMAQMMALEQQKRQKRMMQDIEYESRGEYAPPPNQQQ